MRETAEHHGRAGELGAALDLPAVGEPATYLRYLMYAGLPLAISSIFISVQVKAAQMFLAGIASAVAMFAAAPVISQFFSDPRVEGMVQQRTSGRAVHSSRKQHAVGEAEGAAGRRWP